jgi:hypothetical protein
MSARELKARNYGVFSARYGNVYTVRQAVQLFDQAFGKFVPHEDVWKSEAGFVDPFRPQIEPHPWSDPDQVRISRKEHLSAVQKLFLETDVLIFTLGLTEAFISKTDGSVYPVAPGVSGRSYDPDKYDFMNFSVKEVIDDLDNFIVMLGEVNPRLRIILTVSPVPLIATYETRHVLVSTTLSKAVLRVAAHEASCQRDYVDYFPSFEIISGSVLGARYFEPDLRQVRQVGVDHVMRVFERHVLEGGNYAPRLPDEIAPSIPMRSSTVCDEETIMSAIIKSSRSIDEI